MGMKDKLMKTIAGQSGEALKMIGKEFSNLEDQIIRVQKNQVEFEKYLVSIDKKLDKINHKVSEI